jgi:hypothetical protein
MPELTYPTPLHSVTYDEGPFYVKYLKLRKDYGEITVTSQFEDGGADTLEHAADAPQRWEITYDGLSDEDAQTIVYFYNLHRLSRTFTFIEPRNDPWTYIEGNTVTGCQFEKAIELDHADVNGVKGIQQIKVYIIKRPA